MNIHESRIDRSKAWKLNGLFRRSIPILAALFMLAGLLPAQDRQGTPMGPDNEAAKLVERIQESMKKIDENLMDASASGVKENLEENIRNIEKLLNETQNMSSSVIQDLDQLIKSIKYKKCGSGSGQPPPKPQGSQQQDNKPREEQQDDSLKQNQQPENQNRDGQEQDRPEDGRPQDDRGNQQAKDDPPPTDPERAGHADVSGRWGVLPPKIQNDILNFNIEEFPQKYRKWLEEYYKRVNRQQDR
jgi:hypothetical protein